MLARFKNGQTIACASPTEQRLFKAGEPAGWMLVLVLLETFTSAEVDALLESDNFSIVEFSETDSAEAFSAAFSVEGYDKVTSAIIRHASGERAGRVEIQLIKGV